MFFPLYHLHANIILNVKNKVLNTLNMYQPKVQVCVIFFKRWRIGYCGHFKVFSINWIFYNVSIGSTRVLVGAM